MAKWLKKNTQTVATLPEGVVENTLSSNSEVNAPSVKAVNDALKNSSSDKITLGDEVQIAWDAEKGAIKISAIGE